MTDKFKALCDERMIIGRLMNGDYKDQKPRPEKWLKELQEEAGDAFNYTEMFEFDANRSGIKSTNIHAYLVGKLKAIAREAYEIAEELKKECE